MQASQRQAIEEYARRMMTAEVAHDFKHADRVRNWALRIAREEGFADLWVVEVTALLHDIGLSHVGKRAMHGQVGARMATQFLGENGVFPKAVIAEIGNAIRYHNSIRRRSGKLLDIVRDADRLDLFGAIGIMRAYTSKASRPEYDPENVKGETWGDSARDFDERFDEGLGTGDYVVDQINFQISCYDNLSSETARCLAKPLIEFMRDYVIQLEYEVKGCGRSCRDVS